MLKLELLVLLLMVPSVYAQEVLLPFQDVAEAFSPPVIPSGEEAPAVSLRLETLQGELIDDVHVSIELKSLETGDITRTLQYVRSGGVLKLSVPSGSYELVLKADKLETDGADYFVRVKVDGSETLSMFPLGSVAGIVYDKRGGIVAGAVVKFDCSSNYGDFGQLSTDSFGTFSADLPTGRCVVSAQRGNYIGHEQITIRHGELADVEIKLDQKLASSNRAAYYSLAFFIVIAVILFPILRRRGVSGDRKTAAKEAEAESGAKAFELSQRSRDILKTLNGKEKAVVQFLLKQPEFEATQAKIFYGTGIPKTSIVRLIKSLENRKVVDVQRIAKAKKVRLAPWFMSAEEPAQSGPESSA